MLFRVAKYCMTDKEERDPFVGDDPQKPQGPKKNG
nr:MAG TPA: hypothetical protein [Caudoviricetes sp.]